MAVVLMFLLMYVVFPAVLSVVYFNHRKRKKKQLKAMELGIAPTSDFNPTLQFITQDAASGIAIDESRNKIRLITRENNKVSGVILPYRDIVSVEMLEDGNCLSSQARGALVGGVLLGGIGAIMGSFKGKKTKNIELRLLVDDLKTPHHVIKFLDKNKKGVTTSVKQKAMQDARQWFGTFQAVIRRGDSERKNVQQADMPSTLAGLSV